MIDPDVRLAEDLGENQAVQALGDNVFRADDATQEVQSVGRRAENDDVVVPAEHSDVVVRDPVVVGHYRHPVGDGVLLLKTNHVGKFVGEN